jgi:hypothetical protein
MPMARIATSSSRPSPKLASSSTSASTDVGSSRRRKAADELLQRVLVVTVALGLTRASVRPSV